VISREACGLGSDQYRSVLSCSGSVGLLFNIGYQPIMRHSSDMMEITVSASDRPRCLEVVCACPV